MNRPKRSAKPEFAESQALQCLTCLAVWVDTNAGDRLVHDNIDCGGDPVPVANEPSATLDAANNGSPAAFIAGAPVFVRALIDELRAARTKIGAA